MIWIGVGSALACGTFVLTVLLLIVMIAVHLAVKNRKKMSFNLTLNVAYATTVLNKENNAYTPTLHLSATDEADVIYESIQNGTSMEHYYDSGTKSSNGEIDPPSSRANKNVAYQPSVVTI